MQKSVLERIEIPHVENHYNMTSTRAQYPAPQHGGHVPNIRDPSTQMMAAVPYKLYEGDQRIMGDDRQDLVGHLHNRTPLNVIFFSDANVEKLQGDIKEQVYRMSGDKKFVIDRQNDDDLKIVMRSYYLMFGKNDENRVAEELAELNSRVVGYCAGKIYSEVDFHMFYLKDLEEFAPPIANPMNTQVYGTRYGELKSFF
jgi:hypothetical protein